MTRIKSHFQGREPFLEKFLQDLRFRKVSPFIKNNSKILDLGCGFDGALLNKFSTKIKEGVGVDISVTKREIANNIKLLTAENDSKINVPQNYFDIVVSLAVLEHLDDPLDLLKTSYRSLKSGGKIIMTTPSPKAKPILEFLAFKLGVISKQEIKDHKKYYNKKDIEDLLTKAGFKIEKISIKYFTLGLNTFVTAKK